MKKPIENLYGNILKVRNGSTLQFDVPTNKPDVETNSKGDITRINLHGHLDNVSIGDIWHIHSWPYKGNLKYRVNYITKLKSYINKTSFLLHQDIINDSCYFVLPMLDGDRNHFKFNDNFVNCYTDCIFFTPNTKGDKIYILYKYIKDMDFLKFEESLAADCNFISKFEPDNYHTIYCLNIPKQFRNDYELIKKGKYSEISSALKERILKFHNLSNNTHLYGALYKTPKRRELIEKEYGVELTDDTELWQEFKPYVLKEKHTFYDLQSTNKTNKIRKMEKGIGTFSED